MVFCGVRKVNLTRQKLYIGIFLARKILIGGQTNSLNTQNFSTTAKLLSTIETPLS